MNGQTPYPTVELPAVPDVIWRLWHEVFGRAPMYQQPEPVTTPSIGPVVTPTPDAYMQTLTESFKEVVPPDFPLRIRDALTSVQASAGVTEWQIKYLANAPFDWFVQSLLAFSVGFLVYCLTWIILSSVVSPLAEHLLGGKFQSAQVASSIYLFCISAALFVALLALIWWDASAGWP